MNAKKTETAEKQRAKTGRRPVVKEAIATFVANLQTADSDDYAELWEKEWESFADKSVSTRNIYASRYRNAIRDAYGEDHPALHFVKVLDRSEDPLRTVESRGAGGRKATRADSIDVFGTAAQTLKEAHDQALADGKTDKEASAAYKRSLTKLWKSELDEMLETLKSNTVLTTTAAYRNELRKRGLDDDLTMSIVRPPDEVQKARSIQYRESIVEQHRDLVAVPHWQEILENAKDFLPATDASWHTLEAEARKRASDISREQAVAIGVALGILTGRRPFEIFCQGVFAPLPLMGDPAGAAHALVRGYETWRVLFSGQAKTRGNEGTYFDQSFPIPVLTKARDVLFAWMVLRYSKSGQIWREMTNEEFKADLLRATNPKCILPLIRDGMLDKFWPQPSPEDTPHVIDAKKIKANNVRALYAEIADQFFRPKSRTKAAFFAETLGHTEKDIETASSYMKYYLPDKKDAGPTRRVKNQLAKKIEAAAEERVKAGRQH
jgi:hypothetical protein